MCVRETGRVWWREDWKECSKNEREIELERCSWKGNTCVCVRDRESVKERGLEGMLWKLKGNRIRKVFLKRKHVCVWERQRECDGERIWRMLQKREGNRIRKVFLKGNVCVCVRDRESVKERGLEGCSNNERERELERCSCKGNVCVCERDRERAWRREDWKDALKTRGKEN